MTDHVGWVFVVWIDEVDQDLLLVVRERTEVPVLTDCWILAVVLAKLCLVAGGVVELLYLVVGTLAVAVGLGAGDMTVVLEVRPSPVFLVVVEEADLSVVGVYLIHQYLFDCSAQS